MKKTLITLLGIVLCGAAVGAAVGAGLALGCTVGRSVGAGVRRPESVSSSDWFDCTAGLVGDGAASPPGSAVSATAVPTISRHSASMI